MSAWKAVVIGSAVASVIGVALLATRRSATSRRVALIGDSYAVGLGPELTKLLPDFQFEGHVGSSTAQWAARMPVDWLAAFDPNVVLVSLGVNDGSAPNRANYQTIVRALHGSGARVIWIEPPAAVSVPTVRAAIDSLGVQTVPATHTPLASDGLHPQNYGPWAREIAAALNG